MEKNYNSEIETGFKKPLEDISNLETIQETCNNCEACSHNHDEDENEIYDDDYHELDESEEEFFQSHLDIINAFQIYYRNLNNKTAKQNEHMFEGINTKDPVATSKPMELMYEHIFRYNELMKKDKKLIEIYSPEEYPDNDVELYGLIINGDLQKVSYSLLNLIIYITNIDNYDFTRNPWNIINVKNF